ncbi:hypothetical protein UA08_01972 [Talaromyces atroroseus]|uniref:Uncharacterized protein n=1 Tax=Talaromyces atroroseus TaxID=1441469 RepID=A0A1Q5QAI0_TALAT|nr:hypothetical protein UA08_01972 [Talaromyces atroroseus]OKL62953.1 hypothetical protein UA08_01972 [Talaromyces atroroseus]
MSTAHDKFIGLALAMLASVAIVVSGELMNTAAYAFAPAVLVTPLGALSVLIGAVLGAYFLNENLNTVGRVGCANCLLASILLVLHAPPDREIQSIDEVLDLATKPLSVMSVKAFGIAVKITFAGNNQFLHGSTYVFLVVLVITTLTQTHYLNKAMSIYTASLVNAMYYVGFTTCTLSASFIFYQGLNTNDPTNIISLICGFLLEFVGIALLTISRYDDGSGTAANQSQTRTGDYQVVARNDDEVEHDVELRSV